MGKVKHRRLDRLADLCRQVGDAMQHASVALLDADRSMAEKVITGDAALARARAECEEHLLAATDLRVVLTAVHAVDALERMGDLALHIARAARRRHPAHVLPAELRVPFADMGQLAITLANTAEQVIRTGDPELAAFLDASDDIMDDLHRAVFNTVTREDWPHGIATAVDATVLSQNYERFADHAVALARRTSVIARGGLAA
ncbi:MAG TPA: PhoU domain-containing protein [Kutzneria sp.]|nr:PhoU domain-containing protein [Kutzneria sp.]